ncbi:heavy metal translocating P-type ATPase [Halobaculum sp. MBLA0143]|uniref:heavy metal translocating P-type ATPase n=1 Tax=Halobaculum sp. MBLA0143 TaxID=3079933 RepID=UPI0035241BF0
MSDSSDEPPDGEASVSDGSGDPDDPSLGAAELSVPGMDCPSCAGKVETALGDVAGVEAVDTRPTTGTVRVDHDATVARPALVDAVAAAGYEVTDAAASDGHDHDGHDHGEHEGHDHAEGGSHDGHAVAESGSGVWRSRRAVATAVAAVVVGGGLLAEFLGAVPDPVVGEVGGGVVRVADLAFLLAVAVAGRPIVRNGYYSARQRSLDIDLLMSVAIFGALAASLAFGESLYFEAATLATLFGLAELLERHSVDRARGSLRELMELSPDTATVKRDDDDGEETVPVAEVAVGDRVVVRPGERVPVDGRVVAGDSAVDQSPITGESVPVDVTVDDDVYAGSVNEEGYLEVAATTAAEDNTLARVIDLVEDAQAEQTDREQFVERFAGYYTPAVVGFAALTTLVTPFALGAAWSEAVVYGLTLLVLACPCAFVISTPVSVVSGLTSAAKNGVLVKGGRHLEAVGEVETVAFDKTGTLTEGELTVTDVVPLHGNTETDVLRCARGLETRSEHPVGEAIVAAAGDADAADGREVDDFQSLTGEGVRADLGGQTHYAGKPGLFEDLGFDLSHVHATTDGGETTTTARRLCDQNECLDLLDDTVPELQSEGKTVVLVGTDEELEGVIAVADDVRPAAARTIERLRELGVSRTVMLTGDNERTARAVAERVGVDEVRAELLPEEKVAAVDELAADGGVAMVGDGINDAPALAAATVGVAMGAAGTDTALETADVALMGDDLARLPYLHELADATVSVIRQNVWASLAVKAGLALAVPFGYVPIWLAVLAGDAGMTTAVTGNALRLSRVAADDDREPGVNHDAAA